MKIKDIEQNKIIKIKFNDKVYDVNIDKLYYIIRILKKDSSIKFKDYDSTIEYIKELRLFDEIFLDKINELW